MDRRCASSTLIVVEVALSVVLLVGSGLLLASFLKLRETPLGFNPGGVAAAFVGLPATRYPTPAQQSAFFAEVVDRLRADPRVKGAAAAIGLPFSGFNPRSPYTVEGQPILPLAQRPLAGLAMVSPGYFEAMEMTMAAGRTFTDADREGATRVCIINESLARRLFPGTSPIGRVLLRGRDADIRSEIVGVLRDVKTVGLNAPVPDEIYFPMLQLARPPMAVVARIDQEPAALQAIIRSAVATVDKSQPISFFTTMDASIASSLGTQRIVTSLTAIFAGVALLLSAVGLYSVIAYAVSQRTAEIGIRMALGAQARQVVGLILQGGLRLVVVGLAVGLVASAGAARLIRTLLFQVEPLDPSIYGAVVALFGLVATLACLVPSLRAARVDPLRALRE